MKIINITKYLLFILSLAFASNILAASPENPGATGGVAAVETLGENLGMGSSNDDEILEPDVAFQLTTEVKDANHIVANWQIADKHYLYLDKFKFELKEGDGLTLGKPVFPPSETKNDEFFGKIQVFHHGTEATIPLIRTSTAATTAKIQFTYQGCAQETGICYPPIRKTISFNIPAGGTIATAGPAATTTSVAQTAPVAGKGFVSEQDKSTEILKTGSAVQIFFYFFLGGLALAFTACMYPMIPILSSIIVGHGENINRGTAFTISLAYVESMAFTFGLLGAGVALFAGGVNLQAYFQSPWILIPFALLFVALAFSMFGFYTIQMPSAIQSRLSNFSNNQKGGSLGGAIFMGAASALIIGPCAGPVIIGALAYVATASDPVVGFLAMFILGNGLGLPLLAVGTLGGHVLPKAGTWMDTVKAAAGVVLLAIAILFLERISFIPSKFVMLLWAGLFIVGGVYMGALEQIKDGSSGWYKLWKGIGVVAIIYGSLVMLGGVTGARNFNDPLHGSSLTMGGGGQTSEEKHLVFKRIKTKQDLSNELAAAKAAGKYVMLDFYADWCTYCKKFEDYVFNNKYVNDLLKDFVLLQADVTASDEQDRALSKFTSVQAPPAILFFKDGKEIRNYRIVGEMDAETFIKRVKQILKQ